MGLLTSGFGRWKEMVSGKGKVLRELLLRQKGGDEPWVFKTGEGRKMVL